MYIVYQYFSSIKLIIYQTFLINISDILNLAIDGLLYVIIKITIALMFFVNNLLIKSKIRKKKILLKMKLS